MPNADLLTEIGELWRHVNREVHDRMRHAFRDTDLTPMVLIMLRMIDEHHGITVSELARRSGTVKSHVSKVIDQLEGQGYVEKRSDPADQRLLRLYPTQAAEGVKADMMKRATSAWLEAMAGVPEADLQGLAHGLRSVLKTLREQQTQD